MVVAPLRLRRLAAPLRLLLLVVAVSHGQSHQTNSTEDDKVTADDDFDLDPLETRILTTLQKPFALLSIICSYVMIREVVADQKSGQGTPITRTLFSMAIADIVFSFSHFLSRWPFPSYSGGNGSTQFCTFQGFCEIFGVLASVLFNASLSITFLLMVRYNWTDRKLCQIEPWCQGCVWLVSLGLAIYPMFLELYNPHWEKCYIQSHPMNCSGDDCVRGRDPVSHQIFFGMVPWACLGVTLVCMAMILCSVRKLENKIGSYATGMVEIASRLTSSMRSKKLERGNSQPSQVSGTGSLNVENRSRITHQVNRRRSKAVVTKALWYALAFLMTYLFALISTTWFMLTGGANVFFDYFTYGVFYVSAGTFNFLVYARTRVNMKTCEGRYLRKLMCCACSSCPVRRKHAEQQEKQNKSTTDATRKTLPTTTSAENCAIGENTEGNTLTSMGCEDMEQSVSALEPGHGIDANRTTQGKEEQHELERDYLEQCTFNNAMSPLPTKNLLPADHDVGSENSVVAEQSNFSAATAMNTEVDTLTCKGCKDMEKPAAALELGRGIDANKTTQGGGATRARA